MADDHPEQDVYSENDTLDINELATLNEDISLEFIEQLQSQVAQDASAFNSSQKNDELFEEVEQTENNDDASKEAIEPITNDSEDNFAKKYKSKQNNVNNPEPEEVLKTEESVEENPQQETAEKDNTPTEEPQTEANDEKQDEIENISGGNIIERPFSKKQEEYNASLDLLDDNTKYSKYVVYINPENREFIDSLTVKERKNLINNIIHEQDNIVVTKHRLNNLQTIIRHVIVAIITITIAIPITYFIINMSLEASIDNYRRSQGMFQTLYREHGKIVNTRDLK
ncbi:MAG: hypothetical protein MJ231_03435 [bacterium]|nr:hypothetical protein [bacterium]